MNKIGKVMLIFLSVVLLVTGINVYSLKVEAATVGVVGDDYPAKWKNGQINQYVDDWGYYSRQCTSFVANRLHLVNHFEMPRAVGHANAWANYARSKGYAVDNRPTRGAVAYWSSGGGNHVAWVSAVNGDNITIEEYNYNNSGAYKVRTISKMSPDGYIHFKDVPNVSNTLGDWVIEKTWSEMNIGIWDYYTIPHTLRWQYYDLDKKEWHEIQKGTSNWTSLVVSKGTYWVKVDVLDRNNNMIETKTMGTDGATNSVINAANVTREANGEYLLGATSSNPYMSFVAKLYNYQTGQWFTQFNSQWARFMPEKGVKYRVQFEIYGWNRRLDFQGYDFVG